MTKQDHRANALPDRMTIAQALDCHFIGKNRHADLETFKVLQWLIKRFDMHNISQAPFSIPVTIWRSIDSIFPGEMIVAERKAIRQMGEQFHAERDAATAISAINAVLESKK